jgi:glutathione reductase (NADPH)
MSKHRYDVLIIGGGNAGIAATTSTRAAGLSVALVEPSLLGGTCPNRGCTPKKVLVAAAHALHEIEQAKVHCIAVGEPRLDWGALIEREKALISHIPGALAKTLAERGVTVLRGEAAFVAPDTVRMDGADIEAGHIVIASGSKPRPLPIPGAEHMITSDDVLSEMALPREIVFVGGGVIALEFSHVYARAGARVTILEVLPRLLPSLDADAVDWIVAETKRIGVSVQTGVKVKRIDKLGERLRVICEYDGAEHVLDCDRIVNGAGRIPNIDMLALEVGGIQSERGRILTDDYMRSTSNPRVYVCGDALSKAQQLSPVATYEGQIVGRNIVEGPKHRPDYASIPSCIFTVPAFASVGLSEAAAREKGLKTEVHRSDMSNWLSTRTYAETAAWAKVLVEEGTERILGAQLFGHSGEELIHVFAFAMAHGTTAGRIRDMVYAFPSFSADIKSML